MSKFLIKVRSLYDQIWPIPNSFSSYFSTNFQPILNSFLINFSTNFRPAFVQFPTNSKLIFDQFFNQFFNQFPQPVFSQFPTDFRAVFNQFSTSFWPTSNQSQTHFRPTLRPTLRPIFRPIFQLISPAGFRPIWHRFSSRFRPILRWLESAIFGHEATKSLGQLVVKTGITFIEL